MNQNKFNYILKNFALIYQLDKVKELDIDFNGDKNSEAKIIINTNSSLSSSPYYREWSKRKIPFLFNNEDNGDILNCSNNQCIINYDILSASFYLLSGKQEIDCKKRDKHDRFEFNESLQKKLNFVDYPLVNYYFDILKTAIEKVYSIKLDFNHGFTICLSHDIDEVTSAWKHRIRISLQNKKIRKSISQFINHCISPFQPWKNIEDIIDIESKYGVKSTFFFLTNDNKVGEIKNADYSLTNNYINSSIKKIISNNSEIGLHGSYRTHDIEKEFMGDLNQLSSRINNPILGNRFHFLQWDMSKTPSIIEQSGLEYDTSLGFQEQIGFRNGICNPFYLYDFENDTPYNFLEIPLTIMDCSLAFENYMGVSVSEAKIEANSMINEVEKWNGTLVFNWHNTFISEYLNPEWRIFYSNLLVQIDKNKFNTTTLGAVAKKYKK